MKLSVYDHILKLEQCANIEQIKSICQQYLPTIGVKFFKYSWSPPIISALDEVSFWTCSDEWTDRYNQQNYAEIDPKMYYAETNSLPAIWNADTIKKQLSGQQLVEIDFWKDSLDMGIANGVTIPIQGVAFSKSSLCITFDENALGDELILLPSYEVWAAHLHSRVEYIYHLLQLQTHLSAREKEVLKWTAYGKSCYEIAKILSISQNTIIHHLNNLRNKLNANNKHHLVARAFSLGLIEL